jgi:4-coumarate--CoA ligase
LQILAKGPQISIRYFNNEKETRKSFDTDGFLHTGDLGSIGQDGLVIIHGRIKELIKASTKFLFMLLSNSSNRSTIQVRGTGVAPAELEDVFLGHEAVKDVAVVGIPDTYSGELPKAFIVLDKGKSRGAETVSMLQNFVKSKAARAKWIEGGLNSLMLFRKAPQVRY